MSVFPRVILLIAILAVSLPDHARACAFHFNTDLPEASLYQQLASSKTLVATRPTASDPFHFTMTKLLKGPPLTSKPPHLVDSVTRRRLDTTAHSAVLFSVDADGNWERLLFLDDITGPVVEYMLTRTDHWKGADGTASRRDFAAGLLTHPDPTIRRIALRELDTIDYQTLRLGTYDVSPEQLLQDIVKIQSQAYAPIRILLLGIVGGDLAEVNIARQLRNKIRSDAARNLGAWTTASIEASGEAAITDIEHMVLERGRELTNDQTGELVKAFGLVSTSGAEPVRRAARMKFFHYVRHHKEMSFIARAQTMVASVFTGAMKDMQTGNSLTSILFALSIAFFYGAFHTLGPGHGKAVVISHFIGAGGSIRNGLVMGAQIAVAHVLSAVVIVVLFDFTFRHATGNAPADYRLIRLMSYTAILLIGSTMLFRAVQGLVDFRQHDHHHHHANECASCAAAAERADKGAGWLATAIGAVPCTGALMIMLYGLANDLIGPAIGMVIAISIGMASAMTTLGLFAIWGHNLAKDRLVSNTVNQVRFEVGARVFGATFVVLIGALLCLSTYFDF